MASAMERYLELIHSQLGYKETGTNQTKYGKFFDTPKAEGRKFEIYAYQSSGSALNITASGLRAIRLVPFGS